jgi:integrase
MPWPSHHIPKYRRKPDGRAVVTLAGRDVYLGRHGSPESKAEYERVIGEWLARGKAKPRPKGVATADTPSAPVVAEVILAFLKHADRHYRDGDGNSTREAQNFKDALRPVLKLFGGTPAHSFGPLALRATRDAMVKAGIARTTVNARVNRVRRAFKWAASMELIPASTAEALRTVDGLRLGRTAAREAEPVGPVPPEHVEATLPFLPRPVAAMVRLQLLTGMRAGEVQIMRGMDLTTDGEIWEYRPGKHKTKHLGRSRVVRLGPKSQEIVGEFLGPDPAAYLFRSVRSEGTAGDYRRGSYRQAIARGCDRAGVPRWSPLQLRHTAATAIRARFGLEGAQVALGHARADVTQLYAETSSRLAVEIAREVG